MRASEGRPESAPASEDAAGRRDVRWERLVLDGFGRHGCLDVDLPDGLGVLVRPNEWGKSTLVAGLTAVLFGLPAVDDAAQFGAGRYRGWSRSGRFGGALTFRAADGERYTLERDFDEHLVRLLRLTDEGPEQVLEGSHNPIARKRNERFEATLARLLGVSGREAFMETFCVSQPMPEPEGLGREVQRLLVGTGRSSVDAALAHLADQVVARTRYAGRLGVTPGDKRKDGELEVLSGAIDELRTALDEGREAADRAVEIGSALQRVEAERAERDREVERLQSAADARREYLQRARTYEERRGAQRSVEQSLHRAEALAAEAERAAARVVEAWPEFERLERGLPGGTDVGALLEKLREAEATLSGATAEASRAHDAAESAERDLARARRELDEHERRRPPAAAPTVEQVHALRAASDRALAQWRAHLRSERAVREAEAAAAPFAPFANASEPDRELLRRYEVEAEARVVGVERAEAAVREAEAERRRLLVPDPGLPNDVEAEEIRVRLMHRVPLWLLRALQLCGGGAVAVLALAMTLRVAPWPYAVAIGLVVGLGATALLRPQRGSPRLGRFRGRPRAELSALLEAYDAWRGQPLPSRENLRVLQRELEGARERLRSFEERMLPYQRVFAEPGVSFEAFLGVSRTIEQRRAVHAELARNAWGVAPQEVPDLDPRALPQPWPRLAALAGSQGGVPTDLRRLTVALERLDEDAWRAALERAATAEREAAAWRERRTILERAAARHETVVEERGSSMLRARARLGHARALAAGASEPLAPALETAADVGELLARWRERAGAEAEAERPWDALASLLDALEVASMDALRDRAVQRNIEAVAAYRALEDVYEAHPELPPPAAMGPERDPELLSRRLSELEGRLAEERRAQGDAAAEVYRLERERAALHGLRVINLAQAEIEIGALEARRAEVELEIAALVLAHAELQEAVRAFQSGYRERLERAAGAYLATFSGVDDRRVRLLDDFSVRLSDVRGIDMLPGQLSQGAQDQLVLALRLAIADHMSEDAPLPLLLDDPFLNWDAERLEHLRAALGKLGGRQILLLSHRQEFEAWGSPVAVRRGP